MSRPDPLLVAALGHEGGQAVAVLAVAFAQADGRCVELGCEFSNAPSQVLDRLHLRSVRSTPRTSARRGGKLPSRNICSISAPFE